MGKYYYSNGTFGDESVKEGCETLGLVYKLGASTNDYDTDIIDNYSGSGLNSITGYVVCIDSRVISIESGLGWKKMMVLIMEQNLIRGRIMRNDIMRTHLMATNTLKK